MERSAVQQLLQEKNIYSLAIEAALQLYELSTTFPQDETQKLSKPLIQSSNSVCSHLSEAWQNRGTADVYVDKLSSAATKANETQDNLKSAMNSGILEPDIGEKLHDKYELIIDKITGMLETNQ
jgi:four helix bundle protein